MRVAILCDEYLPSGVRAHAKMLHELALEIKKNGHKPIVITPGVSKQKELLDIYYFEEIEVWAFRSGKIRGVGFFLRFINECLLSIRAKIAIKKSSCDESFDLCINYSPSIFFGPLARSFKKRGSYIFLILRDMFPQWAIDEGIIREKSIITNFFRYFENLNYKTADCIGVQSDANLKLFKSLFPQYKNVITVMNWTQGENSFKKCSKSFISTLGLESKIIFFYGGNIGKAQDMKNIMTLALNMKDHDNAHFLIIGHGDEYEVIEDIKNKNLMKNVTILPTISQKEYNEVLHQVDVGLFSLSKKHKSHNFPGKVLGYMNSSLPILGSVNAGNDLLNIVNDANAGSIHITGEDSKLLESAILMLKSENLRKSFGEKSFKLISEKFSVRVALKKILGSYQKNKTD